MQVTPSTQRDNEVQRTIVIKCLRISAYLYRCPCQIRLEVNGTSVGPILFDLPTLIYGHKKLWATEGNDSAAYIVTEKYPSFNNVLVKKRDITSVAELQACLKLLQNCPSDCERLAKVFLGNMGTAQKLQIYNSAGKDIRKTMGQIMCERYNHEIPYPGKRIVVFYNPGPDCGKAASTYAFKFQLCCKAVDLTRIGRLTFWNPKCDKSVNLSGLLG